jgi:hypothetical protein
MTFRAPRSRLTCVRKTATAGRVRVLVDDDDARFAVTHIPS